MTVESVSSTLRIKSEKDVNETSKAGYVKSIFQSTETVGKRIGRIEAFTEASQEVVEGISGVLKAVSNHSDHMKVANALLVLANKIINKN